MSDASQVGWERLLGGYPWFAGEGRFPLRAYSEFMPPPRFGRRPYGSLDPWTNSAEDPYGWRVSEAEEEFELKPGLAQVAAQVVGSLTKMGQGLPAHGLGGHHGANLRGNPYWPPELAERAGQLAHERYVVLLPLALSRTQDDLGRLRWTLFGSSEQGPELGFWKGFYTAPDEGGREAQSIGFMLRLLSEAFAEHASDLADLHQLGFRILPSETSPRFPSWSPKSLPAWTRPFLVGEEADWSKVRYLLTFRAFVRLPAAVRETYLAGRLCLLPFPGSLVFWGMPTFLRLQEDLPLALQIPLLGLVERRGGPVGLRVPQSGWLHEPRPDLDPAEIQKELLVDTYQRTHRWSRVRRYQDELALNPRVDRVARVLFGTSPEAVELYDKPMARNCQLWTRDFGLLLDGPNAAREDLRKAEAAVVEGGLFGYRFQFPAMRVGLHEVYWHRPLIAWRSHSTGETRVLTDGPLGYLTAYPAAAPDVLHPVELWPRLLRREPYLAALQDFGAHDHYAHQTSFNLLALLDASELGHGQPLPRSLARHMIRIPKEMTLEEWLSSLPERAKAPAEARRVQAVLWDLLDRSASFVPAPITYGRTATREFERAFWRDLVTLSRGRFINKDNADVVHDRATERRLSHPGRDLEPLGDYLISRHRRAIARAEMKGRARVGELPFEWQTDFDFRWFGGWEADQEGRSCERDILVQIPGRNRGEAIIMADHYDTAYMEDVYDRSGGGSGARLAAPGADDNASATATLLEAAPVFLDLAREGKLERDIWLLHLTGEEFPADSLGARRFCQALVEGNLRVRLGEGEWLDLSDVRVAGVFVLDMIAHNRENAQDIFQISPGRSPESLRLAQEAHLANMAWNEKSREWNASPGRRGKGRGRRSSAGVAIPGVALHPRLHGEVRTIDDPQSSLYNTDGQIFSDIGAPVVLFMENYDIDRTGYHDSRDTTRNIDLDYGCALSAIAIEAVARAAS